MSVFLADIEFKYLEAHSDYERLEGGSVFAFVLENDVREAILKIENALKSKDLEVVTFDSVFPYGGESADDPETEDQFLRLAATAEKEGGVQFADFYAYERQKK